MFYGAKFCLVLVGDASSSRRIIEAIKYGCVPVFIGPPYHAEVLPNNVDLAQLGVTFRLTRVVLQELERFDPEELNTQRFWQEVSKNEVPEYVARGGIDVASLSEVIPRLRETVRSGELALLQRKLAEAAAVLTYDIRGGGAV